MKSAILTRSFATLMMVIFITQFNICFSQEKEKGNVTPVAKLTIDEHGNITVEPLNKDYDSSHLATPMKLSKLGTVKSEARGADQSLLIDGSVSGKEMLNAADRNDENHGETGNISRNLNSTESDQEMNPSANVIVKSEARGADQSLLIDGSVSGKKMLNAADRNDENSGETGGVSRNLNASSEDPAIPRDRSKIATSEKRDGSPSLDISTTPRTGNSKNQSQLHIKEPNQRSAEVNKAYIVKFDDSKLAEQLLKNYSINYRFDGSQFYLDINSLSLLKNLDIKYNVIGENIIQRNIPSDNTEEEQEPTGVNSNNSNRDLFIFGSNDTDVNIPDYTTGNPGYAWSGVTISGAPAGNVVSNVEYRIRVEHTYPGDLKIYLWNSAHQTLVWDRLGGTDDGGYDDDTDTDEDIYLNWRSTTFFNGDDPNRLWTVDCYDYSTSDVGFIDYIEFNIYYTSSGGTPNLALYTGTGSDNTYTYNNTSHLLAVNTSVQNNGDASSGAFRIGFYLSTNTIISTGDYLVGTATHSGLANGYFANRSISVDLDGIGGLPGGDYYVGVYFDDEFQVSESDESDNDVYFTPTIYYPGSGTPNLTSYTGTGAVNTLSYDGTTHVVDVTNSVQNNGDAAAGQFDVGWYLSINTIISTSDDYLIGFTPVSGLTNGYYDNVDLVVDLDNVSSLSTTYYLGVIFDDKDAVIESDESDNTAYFTSPQITYPSYPPTIHFIPVWSGTPYLAMNIFISSVTLNYVDLEAGDEVGIFDGNVCVGAGILTETIPAGGYLTIIASTDDPTTTPVDGFTVGNTISYRAWDSSLGVEANMCDPTYSLGTGVFSSLGTVMADLACSPYVTQYIELHTGWNIMSFYVIPDDPAMMSIVQPIIDAGVLVKVMDEAGNAIVELPQPIGWVDDIGNWSETEGYYIKVTSDFTLEVEGTPIQLSLDVLLSAGWNIISYPLDISQPARPIVQPLINAGVLVKVMDEAGNAIVELPQPIGWVDAIINFDPDEGYYMKVNATATLTYNVPAAAQPPLVMKTTRQLEPKYFQTAYSGNPYKAMNIYIQPTGDGYQLTAGNEIGIFDGDVCVGLHVITENDLQGNAVIPVIANSDDPTADMVNGFSDGSFIRVKIWDGTHEFDLIESDSHSSFEALGTVVLNLSRKIENQSFGIPSSYALHSLYPNPFNPETTISFDVPSVDNIRLVVYNMLGMEIRELYSGYCEAGRHKIIWNSMDNNGRMQSSGVYLIHFSSENGSINMVRKAVLLK